MWNEGVYTADPRIVPDAMKVDAMSYEEAIELSNFGGQVDYSSLRLRSVAQIMLCLFRFL